LIREQGEQDEAEAYECGEQYDAYLDCAIDNSSCNEEDNDFDINESCNDERDVLEQCKDAASAYGNDATQAPASTGSGAGGAGGGS
jgi:hypothetical protein